MYLIVTIDTEEDNWGSYTCEEFTLTNIERIPYFQDIFDEFGVKPAYLITYRVAIERNASSLLRKMVEENRCEVGNHCHPWNTPPFEEERTEKNSILCNLPGKLQFKKINTLHRAIEENIGIKPLIFKAGRWGYNGEVAKNIGRLGYRIDTSITPFTDWSEYHGPDFSEIRPRPYWFQVEEHLRGAEVYLNSAFNGHILEVPVTVGFLQKNFNISNRLLKILRRGFLKHTGITGILNRLGLLNRVWLSPELSDKKTMMALARIFMKLEYPVLNMTFHSSSLKEGLNPFVTSRDEMKDFLKRIRGFLSFARDEGIKPVKLSDLLDLL